MMYPSMTIPGMNCLLRRRNARYEVWFGGARLLANVWIEKLVSPQHAMNAGLTISYATFATASSFVLGILYSWHYDDQMADR
mmetsp:Transcript_25/g.39  ORF Transcript_25/g.39 Transcript_25/m.39 type:complete len:82 (-) Transcript_25:1870-2115(-)